MSLSLAQYHVGGTLYHSLALAVNHSRSRLSRHLRKRIYITRHVLSDLSLFSKLLIRPTLVTGPPPQFHP